MDEEVLESIQNFCPCICGIKKDTDGWYFKDELRKDRWERIDRAPNTLRLYVRALEKFSVENFEEECLLSA